MVSAFFVRALPVRVELRDGLPARVFFQGMRGEVAAASGPWRTSGDWWQEAWDQAEWDVEVYFSGGVPQKTARPSADCTRARALSYCITTRGSAAGFCGARTIDVHRTARAFRVQLSGRRVFAGRIGEVCADRGMDAMAVLDRDGVYGAPRFYMAAQKIKFHAHIGAEVTSEEGWRYPLLVESRDGYQNICRLITRMKLRAKKGRRAGFRTRN